MREIKFRAWDKVNKQILQRVEQQSPHTPHFADCINYDKYELMQYTGLKDKHGKEIYEGDIVCLTYIHDEGGGWKRNSKERGVVYFDTTWGVKFDCADFTQRTATYWKLEKSKFQDACDVEVLGNIFENKDVLFKGQKFPKNKNFPESWRENPELLEQPA